MHSHRLYARMCIVERMQRARVPLKIHNECIHIRMAMDRKKKTSIFNASLFGLDWCSMCCLPSGRMATTSSLWHIAYKYKYPCMNCNRTKEHVDEDDDGDDGKMRFFFGSEWTRRNERQRKTCAKDKHTNIYILFSYLADRVQPMSV